AGAARTRGASRGSARLRRRLRNPAVLRAAGRGRAGHPLLHAQPLSRDARDPERAEAGQAVGEGRLPDLDLERLGHARSAVGGLVANVHGVVLAVGAYAPGAEQPAPAADAVLAQVALEHERAFGDAVVDAQLLAHAVEIHLVGLAHVAWQPHPRSRHPGQV